LITDEIVSMQVHRSNYHDGIPEQPDSGNLDLDDVLLLEGEIVRRHYACAGEQDCAMGKCLTSEKERGQILERPFDLSHRRLAGEYGLVPALNFDSDLPIPSRGFTCANLDPR